MLAWMLSIILPLMITYGVSAAPATPVITTEQTNISEADEWGEYHALAYAEYSDEFTALFNGYETKWSKNGRLMLREGSTGPYKFVKKGV